MPGPNEFILPAPKSSPLTGWKARLLEEIEKALKHPRRPAIIVLRYDGCGHWQVLPTTPPTARIETSQG